MSDDDVYIYGEGQLELNAGQRRVTLTVRNTGDRAIQVGSHFHFFETNRALGFDREQAFGMRLDIPAGTAVRFEPGDTKDVQLVEYGGGLRIVGFGGLLDGSVRAREARREALAKMRARGYRDEPAAPGKQPEKQPEKPEKPKKQEKPDKSETPEKAAAKPKRAPRTGKKG
ncbi:urease subunit beta [Nonomuraea zeae]|uniref:Urease subunit beta n=1 Tax=Nonomuraea zeae TaxID=1642303 RepID=A0A5S4GDZ4_9ACTN|nr:urease subunit beta [Nonomuraea zeae]